MHANKNALDRKIILSRTNKTIRGATLIHSHDSCALSRIPTYPRQLTYATRRRILGVSKLTLLTAPSAVHLTTCFSPDSHLHGLSVKASLPLSPLQRFYLLV